MKKIYFILLALLLVGSQVYAASSDARSASTGNGIEQVVGLGDLSTGSTAEVDSSGNVAVEIKTDANTLAIDADGSAQVKPYACKLATVLEGDALAISGAATVYGIVVTGVSAGDALLVYDALTATGVPKFDIKVGTANDSKSFPITNGATFSTGVYADVTDSDVDVTFIYDN